MRMPNLFIVGAAKSGTTALANYLSQSPSILCGDYKEPHFFMPDSIKGKMHFAINTKEQYSSCYSMQKGEAYLLDASVLYLPFYGSVIPKIKKECGENVKIIILLKDPLQRAISAYKHARRYNAKEVMCFADAVFDGPNRSNENPMLRYLFMSQYSLSVQAYLENFPEVLVLTSREFLSAPQLVVDKVCSFLAISPYRIDMEVDKNEASFVWVSDKLGRMFNTVVNGRMRHKVRVVAPGFYNTLKSACIKILGGGKEVISKQDIDRVRDIFEKEKIITEKELNIKL